MYSEHLITTTVFIHILIKHTHSKYDAYIKPTALSAATDVPTIPEQFRQVIVDGATAYGYQYRGEAQQYGINFARFEDGIKHMQSLFINRNYSYVRSTYIPQSQRYGTICISIRDVKHG